jgi:hypothetical protein
MSRSKVWRGECIRLVPMVSLVLFACSLSTRGEVTEQLNSKCEASCRVSLDQCAAASNKIMETALKETSAYSVGTSGRERADVKFESAFLTAENCWDRYYTCAGRCRPPKKCVDTCQTTYKQCFAAGEKKMRQGLREMRHAKFGSPEWQAAYAKGNMETDNCVQENRSCQAKCANP